MGLCVGVYSPSTIRRPCYIRSHSHHPIIEIIKCWFFKVFTSTTRQERGNNINEMDNDEQLDDAERMADLRSIIRTVLFIHG